MKDRSKARASLVMAIEALYLFPLIVISGFTLKLIPLNTSWKIFSLGIFLSICGSITLFLLIKRWESALTVHSGNLQTSSASVGNAFIDKEQIIQDAVAPWQRNHEKVVKELTTKEEELQQAFHEKKSLQEQVLSVRKELDVQQEIMRSQLMQEKQAHMESQKTVSEQSGRISEQEQHIRDLQTRVDELAYELKALALLSHTNEY